MLEEENTNEDVEARAQIDGGDIWDFHPSSQVERMGGGFFCQFCCCGTFVNSIP
jgi:hypothetical protein